MEDQSAGILYLGRGILPGSVPVPLCFALIDLSHGVSRGAAGGADPDRKASGGRGSADGGLSGGAVSSAVLHLETPRQHRPSDERDGE